MRGRIFFLAAALGLAGAAWGQPSAPRAPRHHHRKAVRHPPAANRPRHIRVRWLWGLAALGVAVVALKPKRRARIHPSPLFEMNTRTWNSRRDAAGGVTLGGFRGITLGDLETLKAQGFNSVWFMGIWEVGAGVRAISKNYGADYVGSPYAIQEYRVAQDLGTEDDFRALTHRARCAGLAVFVDFIPNHMGLDSAWLKDHPEYFIHRVLDDAEAPLPADELKKRYPGYFPCHTDAYPQADRRVPKTIMVAYGRDPHFFPWIDTAQLDYAHPGLRRRMIAVLTELAERVDGVRCDMAMLVLREQVKIHRHPEMSWEAFHAAMPQEFWSEAIAAAKRVNSAFIFMAESYWSMEAHLQQLGFDYTYDKALYEAIMGAVKGGHAEGLMNYLRQLGAPGLQKGMHFLENHDEERAMNTLGEPRQRPAAVIVCTLPGLALVHQGQREGKRERLPVQRAVPLQNEPDNAALREFYNGLLRLATTPVFQEGGFVALSADNPSLVSYARTHPRALALVIVNTSGHAQNGTVSLSSDFRAPRPGAIRLRDLFYELKSADVRRQPGVQPSYTTSADTLTAKGLYVDLPPWDAHIFLVERP